MRCIIWCFLLFAPVHGAKVEEALSEQGSIMRRIITILQDMRKQVEADGEKRKELFEAFMCYVKTNEAKTQKSVDDQTAKIDSLKSTIEELSGSNEQLKAEVKEISGELAEDEEAVKEATKVRKSEANGFAGESADMRASIAALDKAIPALRKGMETSDAAALLQSLRGPLIKYSQIIGQREEVMALLQGQAPAGGSGQILGIIEQMRENFKENLEKALQEEQENIDTYDGLMSSKGKEISGARKELEAKITQISSQTQGIADAKEELDDTSVSLEKDQKFLLGLKKKSKEETALHEAAEKTMAAEQKAIQETIKILNDDDAMDNFKKTVPTADSFLQMSMSARSKARSKAKTGLKLKATLAMQQRKADQFAELKKMIASMISDMQQEQKDDETHKEWCTKEIDLTEDSVKVVGEVIETYNQKLNVKNDELAALQEAFASVKSQIKDIDNAVLLATAQRSQEKSEYDKLVSEISIGLSILKKARDKLAGFYEKPSLVQVDSQPSNAGLTQVETMFGLDQPETASSYEKKSGTATGVLGMLDTIRQDLTVEQKGLEMEEKKSLEDYESNMADQKESKEAKEKDIVAKEGAMSRIAEEIQVEKTGLAASTDEMTALQDKMKALHDSCDFLLANFDIRKKARASEIEGLQKSTAILNGATGEDYGGAAAAAAASFLQIRSATSLHHLRRKVIAAL